MSGAVSMSREQPNIVIAHWAGLEFFHVTEAEPLADDSPLRHMPNVRISPHGAIEEIRRRSAGRPTGSHERW